MGNHLTPPTLQDYALHDLPHNLSLDDDPVMDKSRFLKTIKCFNDEGKIIVKVYIKHRAVDEKLITEHEKTLESIYPIFVHNLTHLFRNFNNRQAHQTCQCITIPCFCAH